MAATYLTIGSRFRPYSFEEYVQPLNMYKEEYQRQEDLYNTYAETAGLIGADLNLTLDKDILDNTYNPYMQALNEGADILATEGLSPGGRKQLQELRRRFGREITPIKIASEARAKARENWDRMLAADKTLMTNANPYYKGISAYMNGASPDTTYVSGNELYSRGQNLAEAFSKTMREVPEDERLALQGQYFRIVNQYGANSVEADAFMQGIVDSIPALAKQVDGILANSGIDAKGFTPADKERARQYIIEGMKAGLSGETKVDYLQNRVWDLNRDGSSEEDETPVTEPLGTVEWGIQAGSKRQERKMEEAVQLTQGLTETQYDGQTYAMSPDLKSYAYFVEHPEDEGYTEWKEEMWNKIVEETPSLYSLEEIESLPLSLRSSATKTWTEERRKFDKNYPDIPSKKQLDRMIKREQEDLKELEDRWSYLSENSIRSIQMGSKYEQVKSHAPIVTTPFGENPTDMDKVIKRIQRSNTPLYEYDFNTQSQGKRVDTSKMAEIKKTIISADMDRYGRIIFQTEDGKFYQYEGTNQDRAVQREIQGFIGALTNFEREDNSATEPGGSISYPGILSHEERAYIPEDRLQEGTRVENFEALLRNGIVRPVTSGGNFLWYRATVQDSNGIPVNVVFDNNGIIIGKISLSDLINGGGVGAFWTSEDLRTYAINRWLDSFSSK